MIYVKSLLFGMAMAIVAAVLWRLGQIAFVEWVLVPRFMAHGARGGRFAVTVPGYSPLIGLAALCLGSALAFRKLKRAE